MVGRDDVRNTFNDFKLIAFIIVISLIMGLAVLFIVEGVVIGIVASYFKLIVYGGYSQLTMPMNADWISTLLAIQFIGPVNLGAMGVCAYFTGFILTLILLIICCLEG
ncbi:MAG: hypothetical protein ACXQS8_06565 [Candidatus Helarchaeales archaeon]